MHVIVQSVGDSMESSQHNLLFVVFIWQSLLAVVFKLALISLLSTRAYTVVVLVSLYSKSGIGSTFIS